MSDLQKTVDKNVDEIIGLSARLIASELIKKLNLDHLKIAVEESLRRYTSDSTGVTPPPVVKETAEEKLANEIIIDL